MNQTPGDEQYSDRNPVTEGMDGELDAPDNIYTSPSAVRALYQRLRQASLPRAVTNAMVDGLIAGNPPYDPIELEQEGLGHISNFNDLSALCTYERSMLAYSNATFQTETFCKFNLKVPDTNASKYADIMSVEFDYIVNLWPSWHRNVHLNFAQLVKYGISAVIWTDDRDWRWDVIEEGNFLVPTDCSTDFEQLTYFCVATPYTIQYLYDIYKRVSKNKDKKTGWSEEELKNLILHYANQLYRTNQDTALKDMAGLYSHIAKDPDAAVSLMSESVNLVSFFQKEYNGKWSHTIVDSIYDSGDFLYHASDLYDNIDEFLVVFIATPGEAKLFNSKGVGHKIFSISQAITQVNNSIVDMTKLSSTPLLKGTATGDNEHIKITPGVLNHIGMADMVQTQFGANINQLVGASSFLKQNMEYNITNSGDNPVEPDKTAGSLAPAEGQRVAHREFALTKNHMFQYYKQMDVVVRNMVKKLLKCTKAKPGYVYREVWEERCVEQGVPKVVFEVSESSINKLTGLPKIVEVKSSRVAGDGSTYSQSLGLQQYASTMGGDLGGPRQIEEFRRRVIAVTMGNDSIPVFTRDESQSDENAGGASLAGVENSLMKMGESALFSPDNDHRSHLVTHISLGTDTITRIRENQLDVVAADKIFTQLVPHLEDHFNAVARSPFNGVFVKQIEQPMFQIKNYALLNRKNAQKAVSAQMKQRQEDEAATQQLMNEEERANFKLQREEARKDLKITQQADRAEVAQERRGQIMQEKVQSDAANKRLQVVLDAANKQTKTAHEMSLEELKAEGERMAGKSPSPTDFA